MQTYIIGWFPGNLRGMTQKQTSDLIWGGCQMWSKVSNVRFRAMRSGERPHITFAPYPSTTWAMGAYPATGQILFSNVTQFTPKWARMAFAHEIGHVFGLGHVSRPEALMYTRGSQVLYFDHIEGRAAWGRFGKPRSHFPESLQHIGEMIRTLQPQFRAADDNVRKYIKLRDAEKNPTKRKQYNDLVITWAKRRTDVNRLLSGESNRWSRINSEWRSVGGILSADTELFTGSAEPCLCFSAPDESITLSQSEMTDMFIFPAADAEPLDSPSGVLFV